VKKFGGGGATGAAQGSRWMAFRDVTATQRMSTSSLRHNEAIHAPVRVGLRMRRTEGGKHASAD